ncbi:MAG: hypothetical protein IKG42_00425 [Clostridia bacterium]|nr:hypothetical protein [Clostridia bacterium]
MGKENEIITLQKISNILLAIKMDFKASTPGFKFERYYMQNYSSILKELSRYIDIDKKTNTAMAKNWENLRALVKVTEAYKPVLSSIFYSDKDNEEIVTILLRFDDPNELKRYTKEVKRKFKEELKF